MEDNSFKITLSMGGKRRTFITEPKGRVVYRAAEVAQDLSQKQFDAKLLDEMADFVVELFDGQFTRDDLLDGIGVGELGKALLGYIQLGDPNSVLFRFFNKGKDLPNAPEGKASR